MKVPAVLCTLVLSVPTLFAQTAVDVGDGAPSEYVRALFISAYERGLFSRFAAVPPIGVVRRYGATGLIQEFNDSSRPGSRMALIKSNTLADPENPYGNVYQILTDVFAYFGTVGVNTAGYPTMDTAPCPGASCQYQLFDKKYALFAYPTGGNDPQNITVRDPFYTRWLYFGGADQIGPAVSAETAAVSKFGGNATSQTFSQAVLYSITAGAHSGKLVTVRQPILALYLAAGSHAGTLGYPTGDEINLASGRRRQTFEGGSIEYDGASGPVLRPPVASVVLRSTTPVRLDVGQTLTVEAAVLGTDGGDLPDRPVSFATSNGRVISVSASGRSATVRAVGAGSARLTASSDGKTSLPVEFVVSGRCCGIGEGASFVIQQAFQDAVVRNRVTLRLPGPDKVRRAGLGFVQEFQVASTEERVLLAYGDRVGHAFVIAGPLLVLYERLGGTASTFGFPVMDANPAGRQVFEGGALAGSPVRAVAGSILQRWVASGYESGPPGLPVSDAVNSMSFTGADGATQAFGGGVISGTAKAAYLVSGIVAEQYLANLHGLGFPTSEEYGISGVRRQDFEGGHIEISPGGTEARVIEKERRPAVTAVPAAVIPGGRVRLTVSGFREGATLRVSLTGQPDFIVATENGAYSWDALVPPTAPPSTVRIRAVDTEDASASAEDSYAVRSFAAARVQLVKMSGDTQTAIIGSAVPAPLRVAVRDEAGNPVAGLPVRWTASPGASVSPEVTPTGPDGTAGATLRVQDSEGVALANAEAGGQVVSFSARVTAGALLNLPRLLVSDADGNALTAAAAALIRFYQSRGDLKAPNGLADTAGVAAFLKRTCVADSQGLQYCDGYVPGTQTANLWRLPQFTLDAFRPVAEKPDLQTIRAVLAGGDPAIVAVRLVTGATHFIVATGIAADGAVVIHDPSPAMARTRLSDYLSAGASITGVVRFDTAADTSGFVVTIFNGKPAVDSRTGACGVPFEWTESAGGPTIRQQFCGGSADEYQIEVNADADFRGFVTDLSENGSRFDIAGSKTGLFRLSREGGSVAVAAQQPMVSAAGLVNAATFTPDIAPGGLVAVMGNGLAAAGEAPAIELAGRTARLIAATPFQLNVVIPLETTPGQHVLTVTTRMGTAEVIANILPVAPAIFRTGDGRGAVLNQDGKLNSAANPAKRGEAIVAYGTGLGNVRPTGSLSTVLNPVEVVVGGQTLRPAYAGLAPGLIGVYQVNIVIPTTFPPSLAVPLALRQGGVESGSVEISVQ